MVPSIAEVVISLDTGANLTDLIPEGASLSVWQGMVANYRAKQGRPKAKRHTTRRSGRPSKRVNYAASVVYRAMAEQVERVNQEQEETR